MARTGIRASAIIIQDKKILLIHRINNGEEYWVLPGGGIKEGENSKDTITREVKEETNLDCLNVKPAFKTQTYNDGNTHPYYFCDVDDNNMKLSGPEAKRHSNNNWYRLEWIDLNKLKHLNLVPLPAKEKLLTITRNN